MNGTRSLTTTFAPVASGGIDGIGGRSAEDTGGVVLDGLGLADADAVAAGVGDGRAVVAAALVAGAPVRAVGDEPGMLRSVSAAQADVSVASMTTSASRRIRG